MYYIVLMFYESETNSRTAREHDRRAAQQLQLGARRDVILLALRNHSRSTWDREKSISNCRRALQPGDRLHSMETFTVPWKRSLLLTLGNCLGPKLPVIHGTLRKTRSLRMRKPQFPHIQSFRNLFRCRACLSSRKGLASLSRSKTPTTSPILVSVVMVMLVRGPTRLRRSLS